MLITRVSPFTGELNVWELPITEQQVKVWESADRPLLQRIFPQLDANQREFIKTGIAPHEF